jgi:hypothetical protein
LDRWRKTSRITGTPIAPFSESAVIKSDKDTTLVSVALDSVAKAGFLNIYDLSTPASGVANPLAGQTKRPACEFNATFP